MKTDKNFRLLKVLRYVFLVLCVGSGVFLLLNLTCYFGISSDGPFIRGWVTTLAENNPVVIPHPDGSGDLKMYNMGAQKLVMVEFANLSGMMQARYLGYILFQNLAWVLAIWVLYEMFRIFRNLDLGATFHTENTHRIRRMALAVLAFPMVRYIAAQIMSGIVYEAQGHQITSARLPLFSESLLLGGLLSLVIFGLAEVFRNGTQLQQEQDLTI